MEQVTWYFDSDTREHVAYITEAGQQVEVDRLPAATSAGGEGSIRDRVDAAAALAEQANATAQDVAAAMKPSR